MSKKGLKDILPRENQNRELWTRTEQECISAEIARRKWNWIGHKWQKPTSDSTRQALEWNPHEKNKVGRPIKTWRRSVKEELKEANTTWSMAKRTVTNRVRWCRIVTAFCSTRNVMA